MERPKIVIVGSMPQSIIASKLLNDCEVEVISAEQAQEKSGLEAFRPEPMIITNTILPELAHFQPPLTRAERRKLKRKN